MHTIFDTELLQIYDGWNQTFFAVIPEPFSNTITITLLNEQAFYPNKNV